MNIWNILEIEPTDNKTIIKEAYVNKLATFHPEEDPEGFQRLNEAYNQAKKNKSPSINEFDDWYDEDEYDDENYDHEEEHIEFFPYSAVNLQQPELEEKPSLKQEISKTIISEEFFVLESETNDKTIVFENKFDSDIEQTQLLFNERKFEDTISLCDISIVKYKDSLLFYEYKIKSLLELNDNEEALLACKEALNSYSTDININLIKLRIEFNLNLYTDANSTADKVIMYDKDCFEAYFKQFIIFDKFENYKKVIKIYEILKDLKTTPKDFLSTDNYLIYLTALGRSGKTKEASELLKQLCDKYDKNKDELIYNTIMVKWFEMQGKEHVKHNQYKLAKICFGSALSRDKDDEKVMVGLITLHFNLKEFYSAIDILDVLIAKYPKEHRWHRLKARAFLEKKKYVEGIESALEAVTLDPENTESLYLLGGLYEENKEFEKAILYYEKIIAINAYDSRSKYRTACLYKKLNNMERSVKLFDEVIDLAEEDYLFDAWLEKGKIKMEKYCLEEAIECFINSDKFDKSNNNWHLFALVKCYRLNCEYDEALKTVSLIKQRFNNLPSAYFIAAEILHEDFGDNKKALEYIETALNQKNLIPKNTLHDYYLCRGKIYESLNLNNKAKEDFNKTLNSIKGGFLFKNTKATSCLHSILFGRVYTCLQNFEEVEKYYQSAFEFLKDPLKHDDENPITIHVYLAEMNVRKGHIAKAINIYNYVNKTVNCKKYIIRALQLRNMI